MTIDEFIQNTEKRQSGCLEWVRGIEGRGYGMAWHEGKQIKAHRLSWILFLGELPKWSGYKSAACVLHSCDNPKCVNPDHLFLGTQSENVADRKAKGRTARQCGEKHGMSVLNDLAVNEIRNSNLRGVELAGIYKVSQATISLIKSGKRWAHA